VCASPQVVILERNWSQCNAFVTELRKQIHELPPLPVWYPGTSDRMAKLQCSCPSVETFETSDVAFAMTFYFVADCDAQGNDPSFFLRNEVFGPALGIKLVDANGSICNFLELVPAFLNEHAWGSLSMSVMIDPATLQANRTQFEETFLGALKYGALGVNTWGGLANASPFARWGGYPGAHTDKDIRSGQGEMGNALRLSNVAKAVVWGKWCDAGLLAVLGVPNVRTPTVSTAMAAVLVKPSYLGLMKVMMALFGVDCERVAIPIIVFAIVCIGAFLAWK
jgi:hypothetical protein